MMEHQNLAARAGRWSAAHWKTALGAWLVFCLLAVLVGGAVGKKALKQADTASGDTRVAQKILDGAGFAGHAGESVLVQSKTQTVNDPAFRAAVNDVVRTVSAQPAVARVRTPLDPANRSQVADGGHSAIVQFEIRGDEDKAQDKVAPVLDAVAAVQVSHPAFTVEEFGEASANHVLADTIGKDFQRAEFSSLPVTLIILLLAFGALVAAGLPVLLAFSGVLATIGLSSIASHVVAAGDPTQSVILLIGMAVGVDYSLFYIRREREERARGASHREALLRTAATSGHAVLISGLTVLIAMAGMLFTGNAVFTSIAVGAMLMVAVALIGSLSILPALLSKLGDRVNKGRIPLLARRTPGESRLWSFVLDRVVRRPWLSAIVSAGFLLALAVPALQLHTQLPSFTDLPRSIGIVRTYEAIQKAFPGAADARAGCRQGVGRDVTPGAGGDRGPEARARSRRARCRRRSRRRSTRRRRSRSCRSRSRGTATTARRSRRCRRSAIDIIPTTIGSVPGVVAPVTGETAGTHDFNNQMKSHIPIVFGFVLALCFLLLLVTFRSIVIPIKAVLLNLLSVGAAYGLLVLVFQNHWAEGLLGFHSNGAIASWLPLFMFVILFGLSMDYHVFILSRIKELVDGGMPTDEAVATGIKRTASTVTSAAIVMVAVFAIFITSTRSTSSRWASVSRRRS